MSRSHRSNLPDLVPPITRSFSVDEPEPYTQTGHCESLELSIIVPTFNEKDNIVELIRRVETSLIGRIWELIFVDDNSPDGTAEVIRSIAKADRRIRCIQRIGRRGLVTACIEGFMAASAPCLAVMDADLQHDEGVLSNMLTTLQSTDLDIVIGSRYVTEGSTGKLDKSRVLLSRWATKLSKFFLKAKLSDPMSGFFMIRRECVPEIVPRLSGVGFKILFDIFASSKRELKYLELPYTFKNRFAGESKLDRGVMWDYAMMLVHKYVRGYIPIRFISFAMIGSLGAFLHLGIVWLLFAVLKNPFYTAHILGALTAMTSNYLLNNFLTYHDRKLHGWSLVRGWVSFVFASSLGLVANVGVAAYAFERHFFWTTSAVAGILVGAVLNYALTATYTWRD